ncbi:hypothetical protein HBI73_146840 [Parastagonospora nodorum]|nr:hypothetical protein HBI73_146840 [Parastagonospora nodorum]KAH5420940.1 hypothetical protein HBI46_081170 [Parastagonospora nodorum]
MTYSGWEDDEIMHCDEEVTDDEDHLEERSFLKKRSRKKTQRVCEGIVGAQKDGFTIISPTYTAKNELEKTYGKVYDIGDPRKPFEKEWFQLKNRGKQWTDDLHGRGKRCYATEHILEWQLLQDFIEHDKDKKDQSLCAHLINWFLEDMPVNKYKVKVANKEGKLEEDDHFEYEDKEYILEPWNYKDQRPRYIEWISFQWPGKAKGAPRNPWEYELVVLTKDVNGKKENLWGNKKIFVEPEQDDKTMRKTQHNAETLEWLFENNYWDSDKKKKATWKDNKGTCKAVYRFATAMSVSQYHSDPFIAEALRAHIRRVGDAFELIEKDLLAQKKDAKGQKYKERGLKKEWLDWMAGVHKDRLKKLNDAMADNIKIFKGESDHVNPWKRWDYSGLFSRAPDEPDCGFEPNKDRMETRVKMLVDAYESMKPVEEELKLDEDEKEPKLDEDKGESKLDEDKEKSKLH